MATVGDAYDRCRTGSAAGRGSVAGWTPCPLCASSLRNDLQSGDGKIIGAPTLSDESIVAIMANLPRTTKSVKLFAHGRGLAAHLHAVHTPWRPGKAELRRRRAWRKRMENEERRRRKTEQTICNTDQCEGNEMSGKRRKLLSENDKCDGSRCCEAFAALKDTWEPSEEEIAVWNRRVMEIIALVESESKRVINADLANTDANEGNAEDTKGRDRSGKACQSYRESLPLFLAAAADGDMKALQKCVAGGKDALQTQDGDECNQLDPETRQRAKGLLALRDRNGSTAEHWAAGGGYLDCVAYLLQLRDAAYDKESLGETPAMDTAVSDATRGNKRVGRRRDGKTSLHYAARNGHNHIIDLLLSRNDAPHVDVPSGDGTTPLHMACYGGHPSTVRHLVETHRADISTTNEWECGAAHWAAMSLGSDGTDKALELCAYLKERGVDFTARQKQGHAPLHKAASRKNRHVIEWMATAFSAEEKRAMGAPDDDPVERVERGGGAAAAAVAIERRLHFWEAMICGAISRSAAQTIMHPANTMKTILQSSRKAPGKAPLTVRSFAKWKHAKHLTRGAGAQLVLSIPHGAVNFAVLEFVRREMNNAVSRSRYADAINRNFGAGMDFLSSALSTVCCSIVSTPQMMICDNIMAGTYPNLVSATSSLVKDKGIAGFYTGWWPGIAGKIPSYGLTWTLFEQIKRVRASMFDRPAKDIENSIMGCMASATTVCVMIPMDTVKTRLVTQLNYPDLVPYKGIRDCFQRVLKEEGIGAFYRGLTPRLLSVVPMIGIQFGFYEATKKFFLAKGGKASVEPARGRVSRAELARREEKARSKKQALLQEMAMEVAADDDQPFPAPLPKSKYWWAKKKTEMK
ncbi:hypothetical protein ACHAXT_010080 [Thalassiosira profunda]